LQDASLSDATTPTSSSTTRDTSAHLRRIAEQLLEDGTALEVLLGRMALVRSRLCNQLRLEGALLHLAVQRVTGVDTDSRSSERQGREHHRQHDGHDDWHTTAERKRRTYLDSGAYRRRTHSGSYSFARAVFGRSSPLDSDLPVEARDGLAVAGMLRQRA
jgi:hypothetical protein